MFNLSYRLFKIISDPFPINYAMYNMKNKGKGKTEEHIKYMHRCANYLMDIKVYKQYELDAMPIDKIIQDAHYEHLNRLKPKCDRCSQYVEWCVMDCGWSSHYDSYILEERYDIVVFFKDITLDTKECPCRWVWTWSFRELKEIDDRWYMH